MFLDIGPDMTCLICSYYEDCTPQDLRAIMDGMGPVKLDTESLRHLEDPEDAAVGGKQGRPSAKQTKRAKSSM